MTEATAEHVLDLRARLGEGPIWNRRTGTLDCVDILNYRVHRVSPSEDGSQYWYLGEIVVCALPTASERLLVGLRDDIAYLDPESGDLETLARVFDSGPRQRLNDGKCDARGRLWVGSLGQQSGGGALFRCTADGAVEPMDTDLAKANGLGWSPDGETLYLTDSGVKRIYAYDFDLDAGTIRNRRVAVDLQDSTSTPDGLAVDAEGCLWSAQWDGGCVIRFAPDGGEVGRLFLPVPLVTSCAFGGPAADELYVTTASVGLSQETVEEHVESGDLFRVRVNVTGLPAHEFAGG